MNEEKNEISKLKIAFDTLMNLVENMKKKDFLNYFPEITEKMNDFKQRKLRRFDIGVYILKILAIDGLTSDDVERIGNIAITLMRVLNACEQYCIDDTIMNIMFDYGQNLKTYSNIGNNLIYNRLYHNMNQRENKHNVDLSDALKLIIRIFESITGKKKFYSDNNIVEWYVIKSGIYGELKNGTIDDLKKQVEKVFVLTMINKNKCKFYKVNTEIGSTHILSSPESLFFNNQLKKLKHNCLYIDFDRKMLDEIAKNLLELRNDLNEQTNIHIISSINNFLSYYNSNDFYFISRKHNFLIDMSSKLLNKKQINKKYPEFNNQTLLHIASENGYLDIVRSFVTKGAELDPIDNNGDTPLLLAIKNEHYDVTEYLIENGSYFSLLKFNFYDGKKVHTYENNVYSYVKTNEMRKFLIQFLPNNEDVKNAIYQQDIEKLKILLKRNVGQIDDYMHLASKIGNLEIVKLLKEHRNPIDQWDSNGHSPFLVAVMNGHVDVARFLYENRAPEGSIVYKNILQYKYSIKDALEIAHNRNDKHMIEYLTTIYLKKDEKKVIDKIGRKDSKNNNHHL